MRNFPIEKYKYVVYDRDNHRIVKVWSTYAGETVSAKASCAPVDKFELGTGIGLAAARCNTKICRKRLHSATEKFAAAEAELNRAKKRFAEMEAFYHDACRDFENAIQEEVNYTKELE